MGMHVTFKGFVSHLLLLQDTFHLLFVIFPRWGLENSLIHWLMRRQYSFVSVPKFSVTYRFWWSFLPLPPFTINPIYVETCPILLFSHVEQDKLLDSTSKVYSSSPTPLSLTVSLDLFWIAFTFLKCVDKIGWGHWNKTCSMAIKVMVTETE